MEHILEHRKKITEQLVKSYSGEESTTGAPKFLIIGHSDSGVAALTTILNALEKSQSGEALSIFVDNNIDESKHQIPSAIDSIVLKGFSVEQLEIIKSETEGILVKDYIPALIDLIKSDDTVIEEKYKKKIAALKERRDPEGIEKGGEGSRGGKVIGHTKSGKPIYDDSNHPSHKTFSNTDHKEARDLQIKRHTEEDTKNPESDEAYKIAVHVQNHHDWSGGFKTEDVEKETQGIKKSEELTPGEIERQRVTNNLQKAYTPIFEDPDYLEKGKKAEVGEIRTWGGIKYVKHQDGWVTFNQKTGKGSVYGSDGKKKMDAGEHHVNHFKEKTDEPGVLGKPDTITLDGDHKKAVGEKDVNNFIKQTRDGIDYKVKYWSGEGIIRRDGSHPIDNSPMFREIKNNKPIGPKLRKDGSTIREIEEYNPPKEENYSKATKKPTLEEVDAAFSKVGKALAEGRDPDAITSLRDEAKKLGAAYGMSNEKIDEAISTSKKAHQGEHNQLTEAEKRDLKAKKQGGLKLDGTDNTEDVLTAHKKGEISSDHVRVHYSHQKQNYIKEFLEGNKNPNAKEYQEALDYANKMMKTNSNSKKEEEKNQKKSPSKESISKLSSEQAKAHPSVKGTLHGAPGKFHSFKHDTQGRVVASFSYDEKNPNGTSRGSSGHYFSGGFNTDHIKLG